MHTLSESGALELPDNFLAVAAALPPLSASASEGGSTAGLSLLLAEPLVKKLMREDADHGCRLLLEVLIGLHEASVAVPQKLQDVVSKVGSVWVYRVQRSGQPSGLLDCGCASPPQASVLTRDTSLSHSLSPCAPPCLLHHV